MGGEIDGWELAHSGGFGSWWQQGHFIPQDREGGKQEPKGKGEGKCGEEGAPICPIAIP